MCDLHCLWGLLKSKVCCRIKERRELLCLQRLEMNQGLKHLFCVKTCLRVVVCWSWHTPAHEPTSLASLPTLHSGHGAGSLKLAVVGIFTPWKMAQAVNPDFSSQGAGGYTFISISPQETSRDWNFAPDSSMKSGLVLSSLASPFDKWGKLSPRGQ